MGFFSNLFGRSAKVSLTTFGKKYKLAARVPVARDTHRFTFALESPDALLGLPVGHHVQVSLPGSSGISRAYTPTTGDATRGSFDLVVKVYPQGQVSTYLDSLQVGDAAEIAGPSGEITYKNKGVFEIKDSFDDTTRELHCTSIGMIAGGTGITPMYQIAAHVAASCEECLHMSLVFANRTPADVMLREELESLGERCSNFHMKYIVDAVPPATDGGAAAPQWSGATGRISSEILREALEKLPKRPELICVCGPPGFHRFVRGLLIEDLSYGAEEIFEF
eukprot:TRINITY_DN67784_c0_g1_i1.p1 TRINITY_DN67784_c0_g1~~TRINITY_DN67784_c0_g1_i1.p1  ORF type:complete len:279 (-),score=40.61 TRINITY_DN67784_c0_g1_i1:88-924(-)